GSVGQLEECGEASAQGGRAPPSEPVAAVATEDGDQEGPGGDGRGHGGCRISGDFGSAGSPRDEADHSSEQGCAEEVPARPSGSLARRPAVTFVRGRSPPVERGLYRSVAEEVEGRVRRRGRAGPGSDGLFFIAPSASGPSGLAPPRFRS